MTAESKTGTISRKDSLETRKKINPDLLFAASNYILSEIVPFNNFDKTNLSNSVKDTFRLYGQEIDKLCNLLAQQDVEALSKVFGKKSDVQMDGKALDSVDYYWRTRLDLITKVGSHYTIQDFFETHPITKEGSVHGLHKSKVALMTAAQALEDANYEDEASKVLAKNFELDEVLSKVEIFDEIRTAEAVRVMTEINSRFKGHIIGQYFSEIRFVGETGVNLGQPLHRLYEYLLGETTETDGELGADSVRLLEFLGFPENMHNVDLRYNPSLHGSHVRVPGFNPIEAPEESLILTLRTDNRPGGEYSTRLMWHSEDEWYDPKMFIPITEKNPHRADFLIRHPNLR